MVAQDSSTPPAYAFTDEDEGATEEADRFKQGKNGFGAGAHFHTYGLGFDLVYFRQFKDRPRLEQLFTFSFGNVKDRREAKEPSIYASQGGTEFIYDKEHYLYFFTLNYGAQYTILNQTPFNRLSLKGGFSTGPMLPILKPYMVQIAEPISSTQAVVVTRAWDPNRYSYFDVVGEADFFEGSGNATVHFGWRMRAHLTLNIAGRPVFVRAVHMGVQADVYNKPMRLMGRLDDKQVFWGGFLGLLLGNSW